MTPSVASLTALDGPGLAVGERFRIEQPRFTKLVWEVTEAEIGRSWTWVQRSPGGTTSARHEVIPQHAEHTLVRQSITRRFMDQEANGLKAMCEARHRSDAAIA